MQKTVFYIAGASPALAVAKAQLIRSGIPVAPVPDASVTHLLLPVPSFDADGRIRGGEDPGALLRQLPENITVFGGKLDVPPLSGYQTRDLLKDEFCLAENAAITADCAIRIAHQTLPGILKHTKILIIGWGRIGKHLAFLLRQNGADITVAARKEADRAMVLSFGFHAVDPARMEDPLRHCRVLFNTAPAPVISEAQAALCPADCIKIDLASARGIAGDNVIWARGLPGKDAPEASGALIAKTCFRLVSTEEG